MRQRVTLGSSWYLTKLLSLIFSLISASSVFYLFLFFFIPIYHHSQNRRNVFLDSLAAYIMVMVMLTIVILL